MAILATLPGINLFSSLPSKTPNKHEPSSSSSSFSRSQSAVATPIPIPKYPPPLRKSRIPPPKRSESPNPNPAFKTAHRRTKYYKPVRDGVISSEGDRSVIIGESGVSYLLPGAPFEFQYSYSETPNVKPLAIREPAFLPFAPPTMPRPWTGKAPMKKSKKKTPLFYSDEPESKGVRRVEMVRANSLVKCVDTRTRKEILGEPLKKMEIRMLVQPYLGRNRQVNLGRDGLTHNMLELVHSHWRRQAVCKVRCKGVPTIDMDNICHHLEEKTGGKIIHRVGGTVYLFRGRNYNYNIRPQYPVMLWKPAAPVYPKLIQDAPEGLTKAEADEMRKKAKKLLPICKLAKNGVYTSLLKDVRNAFESSPLVKIDCEGLHATDYKKLGAKLKELVPCVLISFDNEQILMWRGSDWKSMYRDALLPVFLVGSDLKKDSGDAGDDQLKKETKPICSSPKMTALWNNAITSNKALLLDTINLGPDALLQKVEEFEGISQATVYSYPALVVSSEDRNSYSSDNQDGTFSDEDDEDNDEEYLSDTYEEGESSVSLGSLPVDEIVERINRNRKKY